MFWLNVAVLEVRTSLVQVVKNTPNLASWTHSSISDHLAVWLEVAFSDCLTLKLASKLTQLLILVLPH